MKKLFLLTLCISFYFFAQAGTWAAKVITLSPPPTVAACFVSNITQTSVNISSSAIIRTPFRITSCGICYATTTAPTTSSSTVGYTGSFPGTYYFNSNLVGLTANTIYYARAYAVASSGSTTGYSEEVSFTTPPYTNLTVAFANVSIAETVNAQTTVDVTSNTTWKAASDKTWLTVSPSVPTTGNETLTLTSKQNPTTSTRTAVVTLTGTGAINQAITVTQTAGDGSLTITAGGLATALADAELRSSDVTNLTLKGVMDARDFVTLQTMMQSSLTVLNLTGATIAAYTGTGGTIGSYNSFVYLANEIPQYAFAIGGSSQLSTLVLPTTLTSIGSQAFDGCNSLTDITLPNSLTSIGIRAFADCTSLTAITLPSSLTTISGNAFQGSGLTSITIPSSVTSIDGYVFADCCYLTDITLPSSLTTIPNGTFSGCSRLTDISIPSTVTTIGYQAFMYCQGLTAITIPTSVTSIQSSAFNNCSGLTSINIPTLVTSIGNMAFAYCTGLTSIYSYSATPIGLIANNSVFIDVPTNTCVLHVPVGSTAAYRANAVWNTFTTITADLSAPTVTTQAVSGIGTITATGNGNITNLGSVNPTQYGLVWSTSTNPTIGLTTKTTLGAIAVIGAFTSAITDLTANTTYYVRAYATNMTGTSYGNEVTFKTLIPNSAPTNLALSANTIDENVTANSTVGTLSSTDPDTGNTFTYTLVAGTGSTDNTSFNISGSDLRITNSPNFEVKNSYSVRVRTTDQGGLYTEKAFVITIIDINEVPTVSTTSVTAITATTATSGGNIISNGGAVTTSGVCWSSTATPTIDNSKTTDGTSIGVFSSSITELSAGSIYYVRAYATNSVGTSYGAPVKFTYTIVDKTLTEIINPEISDIAVGDKKTFTSDVVGTVHSVTVESGGTLDLTQKLTVTGDVTLKADDNGSFSAKIPSVAPSAENVVSGTVRYVKTVTKGKWYFISFPCDVAQADITNANTGASLGSFGDGAFDWDVEYYDGAARSQNKKTDASNWISIGSGTKLTAYKGYIFTVNGTGIVDVAFKLDNKLVQSESEGSIPAFKYQYAATSNALHDGWNLVGQPYLSKYAGGDAAVNFMTFPNADGGLTYTSVNKAAGRVV
ncbi:MAG: leucine-rich repeat protein, partial [Paludibacter sp.]